MSVGIELTPLQIQAYEDGATVFIIPIKGNIIYSTDETPEDLLWILKSLKIGDTDVFIQEKFMDYNDTDCGIVKCSHLTEFPASQMTKEQSRYMFNKCISVKLVTLSSITRGDANNILPKNVITLSHHNWYDDLLKEYNIKSTYELDIENNRYILLVEFER